MITFQFKTWSLASATLLGCALAAGGCCGADAVNTSGDVVVLDVVESAAEAEAHAAPDYTFDASGLALTTDVHSIVQSVDGDATLTAGLVAGDAYIIVEASGLDTYAELDDAYLAGEERTIAPTIPGAEFGLVGDDLSVLQRRTLIVAAAASGVRSYQAFEVTFHEAP